MKRTWIGLSILTAATLILCGTALNKSSHLKAVEAPKTIVVQVTPQNVLLHINKERRLAGVAPLQLHDGMNRSAQLKADDMTKYNYFGHVRDGKHGYSYIFDVNPGLCKLGGENIIGNANNPATIIYVWGQSTQGHYEAMVNPKATLVGVGISGGNVVAHFCQQ